MIRATAGQIAEAGVTNAGTGAAFAGTVTVYVTLDNGTQVIGTVGSGLATAKGNGLFQYYPSAAETDAALCSFTFTGTGAVNGYAQYATITPAQAVALGTVSAPGTITVADLITASLRRINVLQAGEVPDPNDLADAFLRLQDWMSGLQLEGLSIPFTQRTTFTISSTKGILGTPYTVGTGGDVNVIRPSLPNAITVRYQDTSVSSTQERPLLPLTDDAWMVIPQKNLTSPLPTYYYYQPTYASNFGSLYLWLVPTNSSLQGVLYAPAQLPVFGATSDVIVLPPGYQRFIRDNLAIELWAEWRESDPVDPTLSASARTSKDRIKAANLRLSDLSIDTALTHGNGWYSILTDGPL